jgi:hypothetical protein
MQAKRVFDRCMYTNLPTQVPRRKKKANSDMGTNKEQTVSSDDQNFSITFCYEFLDDSYTQKNNTDENDKAKNGLLAKYNWIRPKSSVKPAHSRLYNESVNGVWDSAHHLIQNSVPYTKSASELKANHPLMIMVENERAVRLNVWTGASSKSSYYYAPPNSEFVKTSLPQRAKKLYCECTKSPLQQLLCYCFTEGK